MTADAFRAPGTHVLMITNHGVHEWTVTPGMPDTGGQNVYVNQFTEAMVEQGYRVTIVNRGGYPHPVTGEPQRGIDYHPTGRARIMYIEDGTPSFVRKEDMNEQIPALVEDLHRRLREDGFGYDVVISHYWDAGKLGAALEAVSGHKVPHVWIPHSLGALKKKNVDPSTWENLRIDERIEHEHELLKRIDGAVATSTAIRDTFIDEYGYRPQYFLPPCVDTERYHPRTEDDCAGIWEFLAAQSSHSAADLRRRQIITEISRTDYTKRKDVLIKAFARVRDRVPGVILAVALDERAGAPYTEAIDLIGDLRLEEDVIVLGSVWEQLPCLYAVSSVYCTPSVMEGFGMSAQEAAATAVPVVASDLVPFALEHLVGDEPRRQPVDGELHGELLLGEGAIVAPADGVEGFAEALVRVLSDDERRRAMGEAALAITVPYFTWAHRIKDLLDDLHLTPNAAV